MFCFYILILKLDIKLIAHWSCYFFIESNLMDLPVHSITLPNELLESILNPSRSPEPLSANNEFDYHSIDSTITHLPVFI